MDSLQYLDVLEARLRAQNTDGRLDKLIAKLDWVSDEITAMHKHEAGGGGMAPHLHLQRIADLMTEVSTSLGEYLAEESPGT